MEIEWKEVAGYEGLYEVSNTGKVRTIGHFTRGHRIPPRELKVKTHKSQRYARARLYKDGISKDLAVHRLVAAAFVQNPHNKPQVNHIDGDRTNNNASNLEWCTQAENNRHAIDNGLQNPYIAIEATKKPVLQIDLEGNIVKKWDSLTDAARTLRLQVSNISHCCSGRIKTTGGFKWAYDSES